VDVAVSSEDSEILTSFEAKSSGDITKSNIASTTSLVSLCRNCGH
jgi:hypothetical protein